MGEGPGHVFDLEDVIAKLPTAAEGLGHVVQFLLKLRHRHPEELVEGIASLFEAGVLGVGHEACRKIRVRIAHSGEIDQVNLHSRYLATVEVIAGLDAGPRSSPTVILKLGTCMTGLFPRTSMRL